MFHYSMFQCSMLERIVKMKNQDLAKLPHSQGKGCWTNKNKTFCENENSLASKYPPLLQKKHWLGGLSGVWGGYLEAREFSFS